MTNPRVFEYASYRQYLMDALQQLGLRSGLKRRAAEALKVHTTFISQVVVGKADLSLDQAERMNDFLGHSEEEGQYFLDLLIYERAAEPKLKSRFERRIQLKHSERMQIVKRIENSRELAEEDQERYYSSHLYGLIHVLTSLPHFRTREKLAMVTGFPQNIVNDAIDFLLKASILKVHQNKLLPGERNVHLRADSKQIWRHHFNWRTAALQSMSWRSKSDLHYSLVFSCSKRDATRLKELLLEQLKSMSNTISESKDEAVYGYCFDLFAIAE